MKTKHIFKLTIILSFVLLCSCKQKHNNDIYAGPPSATEFYYTFYDGMRLFNGEYKAFTSYITDTIGDTIYQDFYTIGDYYRNNKDEYCIGEHVIRKRPVIGTDAPMWLDTISIKYYIKVNSSIKELEFPQLLQGAAIVPDGKDMYYIFVKTSPEYLSFKYYKESYYVSKNCGELSFLTSITDMSFACLKIKKVGDNFYFLGQNDEECPACHVAGEQTYAFSQMPYSGEIFDVLNIDGKEYLYGCKSGYRNDQSTDFIRQPVVWINGVIDTISMPNNAKSGCINCAVKRGDDIYLGGNIDGIPAIWKNNEVIGTFNYFPQHGLKWRVKFCGETDVYLTSSTITEMAITNDKIYSCAMAYTTCQYFAYPYEITWDITLNPAKYKYNYDFVELVNDGTIETDENFYDYATMDGAVLWGTFLRDNRAPWKTHRSRARVNLVYE
ncbi:MAG: hypothetical protein Q4D14_01995 [Bacteroidales bacterium]|nr:hypothetical protein [Bacteroidales bacterium]